MSGGSEKEVHWFRVINNSAASQKYIFFAPPPGTDFDTPAWIASDSVDNETIWNVHTTAPIFAGVGTLEGNHVTIDQSHWWDSGIEDGGPGKFSTLSSRMVILGYRIQEKSLKLLIPLRSSPRISRKMARPTYLALENATQTGLPKKADLFSRAHLQDVTPIIQLYVSKIPTTPGDLIDFNDRKGRSAHISFTGHTENAALCTIFHKTSGDSDAVWDTAYDNTLPEA
ncbi:hypothetical protein ABHI18_009505 [Aspergillus niger]